MTELTDEERYRFETLGLFVRPAILSDDLVAQVKSQVRTDERSIPAGPAAALIDHPGVLGAVTELIGSDPRLEHVEVLDRHSGNVAWGGMPAEPYRSDMHLFANGTRRGRAVCGVVRVSFELDRVEPGERATVFVPGSHRVESGRPVDLVDRPDDPDDPLFASFGCPPGSAVISSEFLIRSSPPWPSSRDQSTVSFVYAHPAVAYSRNIVTREVLDALPLRVRGYLRDPWQYDFGTQPPTRNVLDRHLASMSKGGS
ncbi:phytanoyl-CoA dioxygenase family protein [Cellulomonas palmilytica]|uniref:hypothetical protein n=1 Tax=Cellulomonas palmilytica TaxID=2608402 RepID=UPI001F248DCF|nr:hypothetical protein [Cellulomonas palmilytica]UJP40678.1 hypothetical protein F1D97_04030 [Cellulomonas palmilytica]